MPTFELAKADKLKRMPMLRIMNAIGMIAWRGDEYGCATQKLRLVHPLTWIWILAMFVYGIVMQGVPETVSDIRDSLKKDTVWL
jgi:hypothetical protein